jgi:hypothetical protein
MSYPVDPPIPKNPRPGSDWTHAQTGIGYRVIGVGRDEATLNPVVVYTEARMDQLWVRPLTEFMDGRFVQTSIIFEMAPEN